jgi:hypothetical protein
MPISKEQLSHYMRHGYVLVPDLLDAAVLAAAQREMRHYFPTWADYTAGAHDPATLPEGARTPFIDFPFTGDTLNWVATHPDLVAFVQRVLGTMDIALHQSVLHGKYTGGPSDEEQSLHVDYGGHTLAYPSADPAFWEITTILYYTDVMPDLAPTYVVSWEHTQADVLVPRSRPRQEHPALYAHEHPATAPAGSLFVYNTRTFHRGSAFRGQGERVVHFIAYGPAVPWMGYNGVAGSAYKPEMARFLEQATPSERTLLGFPPPGHAYWTAETLTGVAARYPGMEMAPYRDAMQGRRPAAGR